MASRASRLVLLEHGDIYDPDPRGRQSVLLADDRIWRVGEIDRRAVEAFARTCDLELDVVDVGGCVVVPGFIDPHEHLIGGSGEEGFPSRTPPIALSELVRWGITTVVGTLGADTTTRTMTALVAHAKGLSEQGISAYCWSGGYHVPPTTLTADIRSDLMWIAEIIGAGEIALSDERSAQPDEHELVRVVVETHLGGEMSHKCGVTHFHIGSGRDMLSPLFDVLDRFSVKPRLVYPTHVNRTPELIGQAVDLARRGCFVDMDTTEKRLGEHLRQYLDRGGDPDRLTISSDADSNAPRVLYEELCRAVVEHRFPLERVLPLATRNTASVLQMPEKGRLEAGADGDVVVLRREGLDIVHVLAGGRWMVRDGDLAVEEAYAPKSRRRITIVGDLA